MFCVKCGKPIEDGKTMCDACAAQNLPYNPHEEPVYHAAPAPEAPSFELNNPVEPPKKTKKASGGKRFPVGGLIAAVLVVAIAVVAVVCWDSITAWFLSLFGTPESYMKHTEKQAAEEQINKLSDSYGKYRDLLLIVSGDSDEKLEDTNFAMKSEVKMEIGQDVLDLLVVSGAAGMDMDWLKDIRFDVYSGFNDGLVQSDMGIAIGGASIGTLSTMVDLAELDMYIGYPELSDTYLQVDLKDMPGFEEQWEQLQSSFGELGEMAGELADVMPTEELVNKLLVRYWDIVLDHVEDVEKETETVEVDGVEQKLTVIECTITSEGVCKIAMAILEDMQEEDELMDFLYAIAEYSGADEDDVDDAIEMAIEELEEMADDADSDNRINLTTYIDKNHDIVGRNIEIEGEHMDPVEIYYITVWEKDEFAFEADIAGQVEIVGSGSRDKKLVDGEYEVSVQGMEVLTIEFEDYDEKAAEDGYLNGTFVIAPGSDLADLISGGYGSVYPEEYSADSYAVPSMGGMASMLTSFELEFTVASSEKRSDVTMSINAMGMEVVTFGISAEEVDPADIKLPKDTAQFDDQDELVDWVLGMDWDKMMSNLEKAGLPDVILDEIEDILSDLDDLQDYKDSQVNTPSGN